MKKIFVLTGEPSGDKLASKVIYQLKKKINDIEYLSVGGEHLNSLGIKSIFDLSDVTYLGFTKVFLNIFKIKKKINKTVEEIVKFNPDILFSVDSPDFTLRIAKIVKKIKPNIKVIHFVSPKIYAWRKNRLKNLKYYLDHILLLFPFEKKYYDNEDIKSTFTGHPLLDMNEVEETDLSQTIPKNKKIFSIYPGSRLSEINILIPILSKFIKLMNKKYNDIIFIFHSTSQYNDLVKKLLSKEQIINYEVVCDENIKSKLLKKSIFAVVKSGTISLEICNFKIPSVIIYKMSSINFFIIKSLVNVKFANIVNIAANREIIPELLQSNCNHTNIFNNVEKILTNKEILTKQINETQEIISEFKTNKSTEIASTVLMNHL